VGCTNNHSSGTSKNIALHDGKIVNASYFERIPLAEKVILSSYLIAFGNECGSSNKERLKCVVLKELGIEDECSLELMIPSLKTLFLDTMFY